MNARRIATLLLAAAAACGRSSSPPSPAPAPGEPAADGRARYEGRVIAETCTGAAWLDRSDRDEREQPDRVLDALALTPGMTVADVGAGTGYFTVRLARRVGVHGHVYATEISPEMLRLVDARVSREQLPNVQLKLSTATAARNANLARFETLSDADWQRSGTQEGVGPVDVRGVRRMMLVHDASHVTELVELLRSLHIDAPGELGEVRAEG